MLNFKDWKLASSDGNTATLKHANGHQMTIAMKALPKIQREQIARLTKVQQYAEGSPDTVQGDETQTPPAPDRAPDSAPATPTHQPINLTINNSAPAPQAPPAQQPPVAVAQPTPPQNAAAQYAAKPVDVTVPSVPSGVRNLGPNGTMNPSAVAQNAQEAVRSQGAIDAAKTAAAVPIEQGYLAGQAETQKVQQDLYNQMTGHVDAFNKYIQDHPINPSAYTDNMNGGKKTMAGLGLILGGMGAGKLGSTDNPALRFLNQQIDRDIEGQKARINNQKTVLGAYEHLYGEGVASNNLTKASLLDIYSHKAQLLADKLGTPQAKVNAQQLAANVALEKSKSLQEAAVSLPTLPGTRPTSSDEGAMNTPHPSNGAPSDFGQQGPKTAGMTTEDLNKLHDEQSKSPVQAGIPHSGSSLDEDRAKPLGGTSRNNSQLKSGSGSSLKSLQKFDIFAKDPSRAHDLQTQHDQQIKVDEQLQQVDELYDKLFSETNGLSGRMHRGINPHAIAATTGAIGTGLGALGGAAASGPLAGIGAVPGGIAGGTIGTAAGEGLGHSLQTLTNTAANQRFDADMESLRGIISASLPGRTTDFVNNAAERFAPTSQDSPKDVIKKREAFKQFIVDHASNGILKQYGLLKDKQ